mmetsp:Transcript_25924/g.59045  ORF Transcript_25924/g.59045 Transcript_25924/m.59045 type:complete len:203 (-) Transcript_25924:152-760(-)
MMCAVEKCAQSLTASPSTCMVMFLSSNSWKSNGRPSLTVKRWMSALGKRALICSATFKNHSFGTHLFQFSLLVPSTSPRLMCMATLSLPLEKKRLGVDWSRVLLLARASRKRGGMYSSRKLAFLLSRDLSTSQAGQEATSRIDMSLQIWPKPASKVFSICSTLVKVAFWREASISSPAAAKKRSPGWSRPSRGCMILAGLMP